MIAVVFSDDGCLKYLSAAFFNDAACESRDNFSSEAIDIYR
jgi:hypothetical protein